MTEALARLCTLHSGQSGVQLLDDGPAALAVRLLLVRRARESIDAQYYIWRDDVAGRLLLDELAAAAARGVRVRLLLDDFGTQGMDAQLGAMPGVAVRMFNPFRTRWPRWLNIIDFSRLNRRMHNKSLTVDGVATVVGGRNIGDEYFDADHPGLSADMDALAIGAIAQEMVQDFERYWQSEPSVPLGKLAKATAAPRLPVAETALRERYLIAAESRTTCEMVDAADDFEWAAVRMVSDPPEKISGAAEEAALMLPQLLAAFGPVRRRLLLVSAYFVPTAVGVAALGDLAAQGVQVEVLTNSLVSNDVVLVHAWYAPWRQRLLTRGVQLWEMRGVQGEKATLGLVPRRLRRSADGTSFFRASASALHAKTFLADGRWLFVGSMNLDPRSWRLNTELGFLIESPALAGQLEAALDAGLPNFAWGLEEHGAGLAWRDGNELLQPEPGTNMLQRAVFRFLGWLPLGHLF